MKVCVVTEIRLYRDGVADALGRLPYVDEAGTAATGAEAVVAAREGADVVLIDMTLARSGETVEAVLAARPRTKVVALGVPDSGAEVVACAEAGIAGYVSREATLDELGEALRAAERGEATCSGRIAAELLSHIAHQARARRAVVVPPQLTPRELEVLALLEAGLSNKQIARSLDLQLSTVKNHVHQVLAKHGVAARHDIAAVRRSGPRPTEGPGLPADLRPGPAPA